MLFFTLGLTFLNTSVGKLVSIGESHRIQSNQVNEEREYKVHLPDRHYPVLYVLDGDSHFLRSAASVEFLSAQGEITEMMGSPSPPRLVSVTSVRQTGPAIGLSAVQAHYESRSTMLRQPIAVPENVINDIGYTPLERSKVKEAIARFQSNVDANPKSAVAYDGLNRCLS